MRATLHGTNRRWRYDHLYMFGRDVIYEAGNKRLARQCRNRPERSNLHGNRCARIGDRFGLEILVLYMSEAGFGIFGTLHKYHLI
jgi:hypothetical protein